MHGDGLRREHRHVREVRGGLAAHCETPLEVAEELLALARAPRFAPRIITIRLTCGAKSNSQISNNLNKANITCLLLYSYIYIFLYSLLIFFLYFYRLIELVILFYRFILVHISLISLDRKNY